MKKVIVKGILNYDHTEYYELCIGKTRLTHLAEELGLNDQKVQIRYYIAKHELHEDTVDEEYLKAFYTGQTLVDNDGIYGTSWTGQYGINDDFEVGDHDLINELDYFYEGVKPDIYCLLEIIWPEDEIDGFYGEQSWSDIAKADGKVEVYT